MPDGATGSPLSHVVEPGEPPPGSRHRSRCPSSYQLGGRTHVSGTTPKRSNRFFRTATPAATRQPLSEGDRTTGLLYPRDLPRERTTALPHCRTRPIRVSTTALRTTPREMLRGPCCPHKTWRGPPHETYCTETYVSWTKSQSFSSVPMRNVGRKRALRTRFRLGRSNLPCLKGT